MSRNDDYTTRNLLHYLYLQKYYKLIVTDLSRQTNRSIPQKISFAGKLEEDDGAIMFFISEKQQKSYSKVFFRFIICNKIKYKKY